MVVQFIHPYEVQRRGNYVKFCIQWEKSLPLDLVCGALAFIVVSVNNRWRTSRLCGIFVSYRIKKRHSVVSKSIFYLFYVIMTILVVKKCARKCQKQTARYRVFIALITRLIDALTLELPRGGGSFWPPLVFFRIEKKLAKRRKKSLRVIIFASFTHTMVKTA